MPASEAPWMQPMRTVAEAGKAVGAPAAGAAGAAALGLAAAGLGAAAGPLAGAAAGVQAASTIARALNTAGRAPRNGPAIPHSVRIERSLSISCGSAQARAADGSRPRHVALSESPRAVGYFSGE